MEKVIICGLGAVGTVYAAKLNGNCELKILADEQRKQRYMAEKPKLNGVEQDFSYITPSENFDSDLIIIATKYSALETVLSEINNFVSPKTYIMSLINGISSEEIISERYPQAKILKSYFIGHSAMREGNSVTQDGVGKIVIEKNAYTENIFQNAKINYEMPDDIDYSMWLKFTLNLYSNQVSAILNLTFGEMKHNPKFIEFAKKIISEVKNIAEVKGVKNLNNLETDSLKALQSMIDEGKTSMLQDIQAKRKTEVDIFAGEIIRLGHKYGIPTPYNQVLYDLIKIEEAGW